MSPTPKSLAFAALQFALVVACSRTRVAASHSPRRALRSYRAVGSSQPQDSAALIRRRLSQKYHLHLAHRCCCCVIWSAARVPDCASSLCARSLNMNLRATWLKARLVRVRVRVCYSLYAFEPPATANNNTSTRLLRGRDCHPRLGLSQFARVR